MTDIINTIDALLTGTRVLTQDELFAEAFDRIVGVDGGDFDCWCSLRASPAFQIGSTRTSRNCQYWTGDRYAHDLGFWTHPWLDVGDWWDEHPHDTYSHDATRSGVCWRCDVDFAQNKLGLCRSCDAKVKGENVKSQFEQAFAATLFRVSEG